MHASSGLRTAAFVLATGVASVVAPSAALALDNDPALRGFGTYNAAEKRVEIDRSAYHTFVRELGMAMSPHLLAPAETLGLNGFAVNLAEYSATNIDESSRAWKRGTEQTLAETIANEQAPTQNSGAQPPGYLHTLDFRVRKGLPYSFELGTSITYLLQSELLAFGGELKWALNEAVDVVPVDFAFSVAVNRCFGSTDLDLTTLGLNFVLGHKFGIGGVVNLAPYMAYNPTFVFARSGVLDVTPGIDEEVNANDAGSTFVLPKEDVTLQRFVFGARLTASVLSITPEIALTKGLQSYNVALGLDF